MRVERLCELKSDFIICEPRPRSGPCLLASIKRRWFAGQAVEHGRKKAPRRLSRFARKLGASDPGPDKDDKLGACSHN